MTSDEHAAQAERLVSMAESIHANVDDNAYPDRELARMHNFALLAQVHAALALRSGQIGGSQ